MPSGDLLEYTPYSKKISIVTSDLLSDPKDPKRKNNINPKDIPAEKGKQRMKELLQKPDLNLSLIHISGSPGMKAPSAVTSSPTTNWTAC